MTRETKPNKEEYDSKETFDDNKKLKKVWSKLLPNKWESYRISRMTHVPFLMSSHVPNYRSKVVNTDSRGLREGIKYPDQPISNAIFGGSTAFGDVADSDEHTISSFLATKRGENWANYGVEGYNGFQEILLFMTNIEALSAVKRVFLVSGINDLNINILRSSDHYAGSYYQESDFYNRFCNRTRVHVPWIITEKLYSFRNGGSPWLRNVPIGKLLKGIWGGRGSAIVKNIENQYKNSLFNSYPSLEKQINRNLLIWKNLSKAMGFDLYYVLQPWLDWTGKGLSSEERELINALDFYKKRGLRSAWSIFSSEMNDKKVQQKCISMFEKLCNRHNITFIDSNEKLKGRYDNDWLFIDRVHLTHLGNKWLAELINECIEEAS